MKVLDKKEKKITGKDNSNISALDKNKILLSQNKFLKTKKSYSIEEAYNIGLTKLKF